VPKKKIIFAITKSFWGGAQRYVYDLAVNLPKDLYDVMVITGGNGPLVDKLQISGIRTINLSYLGRDVAFFSDIKTFLFLFQFFHNEKPDIVHLNSSKMGGIGAIAGKLAGVKKIIFTCHGWAFNEDRPWLAKKAIKLMTWLSLLFQDKIIAVSKAVINDISGLPLVSKKFFLIHNGVKAQPGLEKGAARDFLAKKLNLKISSDTVWIGTVSELTKNKGIEYAIKALVPIRRLPFIFIIIGEGELKEKLKDQISNLKIEDKVFLAGYLEEAKKYLAAFDIFTLTSITEAFPYVLLEAGNAGISVLASDVGGIKEIITDKKNGILVKTKDIGDISKNLTRLIEDKEEKKKLGRDLKETIASEFSFEKMLEKTFNLY